MNFCTVLYFRKSKCVFPKTHEILSSENSYKNHKNDDFYLKILSFDQYCRKKIRLAVRPLPGDTLGGEQPPAARCAGAKTRQKNPKFLNFTFPFWTILVPQYPKLTLNDFCRYSHVFQSDSCRFLLIIIKKRNFGQIIDLKNVWGGEKSNQ